MEWPEPPKDTPRGKLLAHSSLFVDLDYLRCTYMDCFYSRFHRRLIGRICVDCGLDFAHASQVGIRGPLHLQ